MKKTYISPATEIINAPEWHPLMAGSQTDHADAKEIDTEDGEEEEKQYLTIRDLWEE